MKVHTVKRSLFFKAISLILVLTFPLTNISYAQQATGMYNEDIVKGSDITPLLRIANGASWVVDPSKRDEIIQLDGEIGKVIGDSAQFMSWIDKSEATVKNIVRMVTEKWVHKIRDNMKTDLGPDAAIAEWNRVAESDTLWNEFRSIYMNLYREDELLNKMFRDILIDVFDANRVILSNFDTPGRGHISWGDQNPLSEEKARKIDRAIKDTAEKGGIVKQEKVGNGTFMVLDPSIYDQIAEEFGAPLDVMCHPGTNGTKEIFNGTNFEKVKQSYYIKESLYNSLTQEDKIIIANHEEMHIKIALGIIKMSDEDKKLYKNEEDFINHQPGCDTRLIMAKLGSEVHKMELAKEKPIYAFGTDLEGKSINESINDGYRPPQGWIDLLGGKGANLAGLAGAKDLKGRPIPVPPGFTLTTEVAKQYISARPGSDGKRDLTPEIKEEIDKYVERIEKAAGRKFTNTGKSQKGDDVKVLLLSGRSGARLSMPGMMDTVLNIGLNDETVKVLANETNERFAWDSYRRLIMMFGDVVLGASKNEHGDDAFEEIIEEQKEIAKERLGTDKTVMDTDLSVEDLKDIVEKFKAHIKKQGMEMPQDVKQQMYAVVRAVFDSSFVERVVKYRKLNNIPDDTLSAVNMQTMVFGNLNDNSATGVCFTRDPGTGEKVFYGEWLRNAQGEDVVSGVRTPMPINIAGKNRFIEMHPEYAGREDELESLEEAMPEAYNHLVSVYMAAEQYQHDMQDMEFTVQDGTLYLLQTRNGKRTAVSALNILMDMVEEGLITKKEALTRLGADQVDSFLHPVFSEIAKKQAIADGLLLATGLNASPGAVSGRVVFSSAKSEELAAIGVKTMLVRPETSPADIGGMDAAQGILTSRGGLTSHAAVVCRGWGKTAVVGAGEININDKGANKYFSVGERTVKEGDTISIDGSTGEVFLGEIETRNSVVLDRLKGNSLKAEDQELFDRFSKFFKWVDEYRGQKIEELHAGGVRTNAEGYEDVHAAFAWFDADGIGLARTEHMFFKDANEGEDRILKFRKMIMTNKLEELKDILKYQANDFYEILSNVKGRPVTIRLVDPPLHEFLPNLHDFEGTMEENLAIIEKFSKKFNVFDDKWTTKRILEIARKENISTVQAEVAILAQHLKWEPKVLIEKIEEKKEKNPMAGLRGCRLLAKYPVIAETQFTAIFEAIKKLRAERIPYSPVEIEIPLAGVPEEINFFIPMINEIAAKYGCERDKDYKIGTMIETPSAVMMAGEIAPHIDFMSFGTNDLTQFSFKFSRDDAGNIVIPEYIKDEILKVDPFKTLDEIVIEMIRIAVAQAKAANPSIDIGLCGEQGGDPVSVPKLVEAGLDYTSCSPYRLLTAKLATVQHFIKKEQADQNPVVKYDLRDLEAAPVDIEKVKVMTTEDVLMQKTVVNKARRLILVQTNTIRSAVIERLTEDLNLLRSSLTAEERFVAALNWLDTKTEQFSSNVSAALNKLSAGKENDFVRLFDQDLFSVFSDMTEDDLDSFANSLSVSLGVEPSLIKNAIEKLEEFNPAMGLIGARQPATWYKSLYEAQLKAIFTAMKADSTYTPNIIVPLLVDSQEFGIIKELAEELAKNEGIDRSRFNLGASIETGRAALTSHKFAKIADFMIFNNTGLTESVLALTEEDARSFIPIWLEQNMYDQHPFEVLSERNVGRFINLAVKRAVEVNKWIPIYSFGVDRSTVGSPVADTEKENVLEVQSLDPATISTKVAGTDEYGINVTVRIEEDGTPVDVVTMHAESAEIADILPLVKDREHEIIPKRGGFSYANEETIIKTRDEPLVLEVRSKTPDIEKATYAVFRAGKEAIVETTSNTVDLIMPGDSFEGAGSASKTKAQQAYDSSYGKDVLNIVTFNSALGTELKTAIENSIRAGRTPIVALTNADLESVVSNETKEALEKARILPLVDRQNIIVGTLGSLALLQASLKAEDIQEKGNPFTQKMIGLMSNLTGTKITANELYYMLPYSDGAIPEGIKTSDIVSWLNKVFEILPMVKLIGKVSEEFHQRLNFMYAA